MRALPTRLIVIVAVMCLGTVSGCSQQASSDAVPGSSGGASAVSIGTHVGSLAPSLELPTLMGTSIDLSSLRGKVVLINFWATWCGPCIMEMPSMQRLYERFRKDDFEIVAISSDYQGERVVRPYVERLELSFPILLDSRLEVNDLYKVTGIPTTIIVDRDGVITHKFFGSRDWDTANSHELIAQILRSRA